MVGAIVSTLLAAFVIGLLARWTVPGPDPMPIWMTSFSSSAGAMPSTSLRPLRRRPGTVGDSSDRNSAMSETPLTIDSGVIPFSSL